MVGFNIFSAPVKNDTVEIWPENVPAVELFISVSSQWRVGGAGGATGLDYTAVLSLLDRTHRNKPWKWRDALFSDIQFMESAALKEMAKK